MRGSGDCNRLMGGFQLACEPAVMAFEKRNLLLQNGQGRTLLIFTATP